MAFIVTADHLAAIAGRRTALMPALAEWLNRLCPQYEIDTAQEFCHFLAQACHETDHFKTLREYASGRAYEGRADLGNTHAGDGVRFKGRGIFQTTGRANYLQLGVKEGHRDLFINNPELLEQPQYAVWSACEFWVTRGLNDIAIHADGDVLRKKYKGRVLELSPLEYISYTINGGNRGLEERKRFFAIARGVLVEVAEALPAASTRGMPGRLRRTAGESQPAERAAKPRRRAPARGPAALRTPDRAKAPAKQGPETLANARPEGRSKAREQARSPTRSHVKARPRPLAGT